MGFSGASFHPRAGRLGQAVGRHEPGLQPHPWQVSSRSAALSFVRRALLDRVHDRVIILNAWSQTWPWSCRFFAREDVAAHQIVPRDYAFQLHEAQRPAQRAAAGMAMFSKRMNCLT